MRCQTTVEYLILISTVIIIGVVAFYLTQGLLSTAGEEANKTKDEVHNGINNIFNSG